MTKKLIAATMLFVAHTLTASAFEEKNAYRVLSPDSKIRVVVRAGETLTYYVLHERDTMISSSPVSLALDGGEILGRPALVKSTRQSKGDEWINTTLYKRLRIHNVYNELTIQFKEDYAVTFRVSNDGVAYRFSTSRAKPYNVRSEEATFRFPYNVTASVPFVSVAAGPTFTEQFFNSFENTYTVAPIAKLDSRRLAFLPLAASFEHGKKVCITEADLESYPGMYLKHTPGKNQFEAVMAPVPKDTKWGGHNNLQELVLTHQNIIAECQGTRNFPWRVMAISANDKELADNDLVYKLASASRLANTAWIKPGKVAWDWWNDWNIRGVNFKSGVNNETYKYYIDFAAKYQMEYVILDEGWAVKGEANLMKVVPEIDIKGLIDYAANRNVGIILWAGFNAFNRDMDKIAGHYAAMGVKGFKIDFMNRDDQKMVDFYYRAAETCAKYKLMADFHGAYKPTGLNRTWPNVINFEGVHGLEQMKWSTDTVDQVTYDVTMPFIRMLAGPIDYTQGALRNATRKDYFPAWSSPMSQGTRCRQLAEYVVFESPLNMLCDNPSNYMAEPECTAFISSVPKVWDETIAISGEMGKHIAIARKKDGVWYVGALTNWDAREQELDLSFLGKGSYRAEIFQDGINADKNASDYKYQVNDLPESKKLKIVLAPGGGYAARITRK